MNKRRFEICAFALVALLAPAAPLCNALEFVPCLDALCRYSAEDTVKNVGNIPQTSATILSLANFGFLLAVRLSSSHIRAQLRYLALAFAAIAVMTVLQVCLIMYAQVWEVYALFYAYTMLVTGISLIVAGACFLMTIATGHRLGDREARNSDDMYGHAANLKDDNAADGDGAGA